MPTREELMQKLRAADAAGDEYAASRFAEMIREGRPELSGMDTAVAAATEFAEGTTGYGTELGAFGSSVGSAIYDVLNTDKSLGDVISENFSGERLDANFDRIREKQDQFEDENPMLSDLAAGAGMVAGLAVPGATLARGSKAARIGLVAAEGAVYGAGTDDGDRLTGAALGAAIGGSLGAGTIKLTEKLEARRLDRETEVADELEVFDELAEEGGWTNVGDEMGNWEEYATGVSDGLTRKVSPEVGGRVQRADETAMRQRNLDMKEYVENAGMKKVIQLAEDDGEFKGMILDFAKGAGDQSKLAAYVTNKLGQEESDALLKYLRWSENQNTRYNKRLGNNESAAKYLHTQKEKGLPGDKPLPKKEKTNDYVDFDDDDLNLPVDKATLDRTRGLAMKGEVKVGEYANPFLTNANRIHNNNRLLEIQEKFGLEPQSGGAEGLMRALEKKLQTNGIDELGARQARNAIATLIKGQNKSAKAWIKSVQNSGYTVLAGPKTVLLNFHDWPVAMYNNGIDAAKGLFKKKEFTGADVQRLGIDGQNVGEFVQDLRRSSANMTKSERAEAITNSITSGLMKYGGFATADRVAKNGVLKMVANDTVKRAKAGNLSERWGSYFDAGELARVEGAIKRTGGDVSKMTRKEQKVYDEIITMGLGQQQLISAAGRPPKWLDNPDFRPFWMMRGFAIKHNHLLMENVVDRFKKGDKAGAMKNAALYVAVPGSSYAGMNLARNEVFKEDYEATPEEFMYSLLDSVLGPATLNTIGLGTAYERGRIQQEGLVKTTATNLLLPPMGLYGDVGESLTKAVTKGDPTEVAAIVAEHPFTKQWLELFD